MRLIMDEERYSSTSVILGFVIIGLIIVVMPTYRKLATEQLDLCDQVLYNNISADKDPNKKPNDKEPAIVEEMKKEEEAKKSKVDVSNDPVLRELRAKVEDLEKIENQPQDGGMLMIDVADRTDYSTIDHSSNSRKIAPLSRSGQKLIDPQDIV